MKSTLMHGYILTFFIGLSLILSGCEKEFKVVTETEEEGKETVELVSTNIEGSVLDQSILPISNVIVELSVNNTILESTLSDENGNFSFDNARVSELATLIVFRHPEFSNSYKVLPLQREVTHYTDMILTMGEINQFDQDEIVDINTDRLSVTIDKNQIQDLNASGLIIESRVLFEDELKERQLIPVNGINETSSLGYIEHQLVFQLDMFDSNRESINLKKDEAVDVVINTNQNLSNLAVWYFNTSEARWQEDTFATLLNDNTITVNKTGLYALSSYRPSFSYQGILRDANDDPLANTKLIVKDKDGNIIHEGYSNSNGEFEILTYPGFSGTVEVVSEGEVKQEIVFDDITQPELRDLTITQPSESLVCNQEVVVEIPPFSCEGEISPGDILINDNIAEQAYNLEVTSGGRVISIGVVDIAENFSELPWADMVGNNTPYTLTILDWNTGDPLSCTGNIIIEDKVGPVPACLSNISISLMGEDEVMFYATDALESSIDNCDAQSPTVTIAISVCDEQQNCEEGEFAEAISFTKEDVEKSLRFRVKVKDTSGNENFCWGEVVVVEGE